MPRYLFALLSLASLASTLGAAPIHFSREIRPILSENCFACHGPDDKKREGGLRLDDEAGAKKVSDGVAAIVPGHPEKSSLIERITSTDPDEVMPPPKLHKKMSPAQVALLSEWIKQGAPWGNHWSYERVQRPPLPAGKPQAAGAGNAIDAFIAQRLEHEKLDFAPAADRAALLRRVALDLTGLPPTLEELDRFGQKGSMADIIAHYLAQPSYGEHWARLWLDLARYADSSGYPSDQPREIWAYRDWVIRAFNANMPFDQFTIEQLGGDLLPGATDQQIIATAFHRNTMTQNEGGTSDEEFRNAAVIDRVNTTMAVWMGTSMACAQCHTHKYDPITQKEYFQFYAILNQSADSDKKDEAPLLEFSPEEQKQQLAAWKAEQTSLEAQIAKPSEVMLAGYAAWEQSFAKPLSWVNPKPLAVKLASGQQASIADDGSIKVAKRAVTETHTIDLPVADKSIAALRLETQPGANFVVSSIKAQLIPPSSAPAPLARFVRVELPGKGKMLQLAEVQVFSQGNNIAPKGKASQSSQYTTAHAGLANDGRTDGNYQAGSVAHTNGDDNAWWMVDLGSAQPIERIVVWNRTDGGASGRLEGFKVSALTDAKQVVWQSGSTPAPAKDKAFTVGGPVEIVFSSAVADYEQSGFSAAAVLNPDTKSNQGWAVAGATDKPHTLTLLTTAPLPVPAGSTLRVTVEQRSEFKEHTLSDCSIGLTADARAAAFAKLPAPVLAAIGAATRSPAQVAVLRDHYVRQVSTGSAKERARLTALAKDIAALKPNTVPVMRDLTGKERRITRVQLRGNWQALDEEVSEAVPAAFHSLPKGITQPNRLDMARWLVSRDNPLTARVMMNRLWDQLFGAGIVRTSEEFGSQGELPSHPELLDWLAAEFMESGWNMQHMLTLMLSSRTYQQNSSLAASGNAADYAQRSALFAIGPRFRPTGEMLRDQALAVSGLLSSKMYGPAVRPLAPSLGLSTAFGRGNDWVASEGEDKHRRSLYTEVRRNAPYASFMTFDATNREVCTLRRGRTNTPLQAFVTLNDPVFIECAQALARRLLSHKGSDADRLQLAYRLCLSRAATANEVTRLSSLLAETQASFAADLAAATKLATEPLGPAPAGSNIAALAAWTTVANVIMNLDEYLMRR